MATKTINVLAFVLLLQYASCYAQIEQVTSRSQGQQPHRFRGGECQIERLNTLEPSRRIEAEAGVSELWDEDEGQLQCAGVAVVRHIIQKRGLFLPAFTNAPELMYVVQGRGFQGVVFPGCPETYQSPEGSQHSQSRYGGQMRGERTQDQHQKVQQIREGDIIALPAGATHWIYNQGQSELVIVSVVDLSNQENQLDHSFRKFFLAGNPQQGRQQQGGSSQSWGPRRRGGSSQQESFGNIFSGFDEQILSESFAIDTELAQKLKCQDDQRGHIVEVQNELQIVSPRYREGEQEGESEWKREREWRGGRRRGTRDNGLEETLCTMRLRENINKPEKADIYNPRGGRFTTLNSFSLPILSFIGLSATRAVLYRDAIVAPHYHMNCHGVIYVTRGSGRIQIVDDSANTVFDGQLQEGQLLVVPQNFAVVKKAGSEGFEYVSFRTNDNAMVSSLAGRLSVIRSLPEQVVMNSYDVSREEARRLKYSREEFAVLSPGSRSSQRGMKD
ncbi:11S globulin seed storage protein 1 [Eucalyptus grandis]|uniref:11S globulin seed storage protein 1 n=1 Tax=Eucalyptus grandis TaxID=71139 RepID=UPI00192EEA0D|nr:11S globulin seed storage protein 1 [Eucalyptus grandis]